MDGAKNHEQSRAPDTLVEKTFSWAVLVRWAKESIERQRREVAARKAAKIGNASLVLLTCQGDESEFVSKQDIEEHQGQMVSL